MKKLVFALLGIFLVTVFFACAKNDLWLSDFATAQQSAKSQQKPILLNFTGSDWCPPCVVLKRDVFSTPQFIEYAKANLVLMEVDFPRGKTLPDSIKKQNDQLRDEYNISGYPTIIILDAVSKKIGEISFDFEASNSQRTGVLAARDSEGKKVSEIKFKALTPQAWITALQIITKKI
jgi:thioredoxin-related protein